MTTTTVERQDSRGEWNLREIDLSACLTSRAGRLARTRTGVVAVETVEQAAEMLAQGFALPCGSDWYDMVRLPREARTTQPADPTDGPSLGYDRSALAPGEGFYGS